MKSFCIVLDPPDTNKPAEPQEHRLSESEKEKMRSDIVFRINKCLADIRHVLPGDAVVEPLVLMQAIVIRTSTDIPALQEKIRAAHGDIAFLDDMQIEQVD